MRYSDAKKCIEDIGKEDFRELLDTLGNEIVDYYCQDIDKLKEVLKQHDIDVIKACFDCDIDLNHFDECYQGNHTSDEGFVEQLLEDCGDIPSDLPHYIYIDWERTANCVMQDYSESNGYYFRNY